MARQTKYFRTSGGSITGKVDFLLKLRRSGQRNGISCIRIKILLLNISE